MIASPIVLGDPTAAKMEIPVVQKWFADRGDQTLRVEYPLTRESIVLDAGGYEGNWAAQIDERYGCTIHIFEPVPVFAQNIQQRFRERRNIHVHPYGISDHTGRADIRIDNDSTSVHRTKGRPIDIELRSAQEVFATLGIGTADVDLIKINIEGCEYELLQHFIDTGMIGGLRDIQVQFHDFVPDAPMRMKNLQQQIETTHELMWQYRFVWENWRRRDQR